MKKQKKMLSLHRETLQKLGVSTLTHVVGRNDSVRCIVEPAESECGTCFECNPTLCIEGSCSC